MDLVRNTKEKPHRQLDVVIWLALPCGASEKNEREVEVIKWW